MRINTTLLVVMLWIISKKIISQFSMRLLVYSHKNNIKTFRYYSHNILIRLLRSEKDRRKIGYLWRQFIENKWKKKCSVIFELDNLGKKRLLLKNGLQRKYEIFPVYMTKVTELQRKKSEKERMAWGEECLWLRRNYKGNLDLLKRCTEKLL